MIGLIKCLKVVSQPISAIPSPQLSNVESVVEDTHSVNALGAISPPLKYKPYEGLDKPVTFYLKRHDGVSTFTNKFCSRKKIPDLKQKSIYTIITVL